MLFPEDVRDAFHPYGDRIIHINLQLMVSFVTKPFLNCFNQTTCFAFGRLIKVHMSRIVVNVSGVTKSCIDRDAATLFIELLRRDFKIMTVHDDHNPGVLNECIVNLAAASPTAILTNVPSCYFHHVVRQRRYRARLIVGYS